MSTILPPAPRTEPPLSRIARAPAEQTLAWAVGTLMVTTPAPTEVARDILSAAAARAAQPATVMAHALLAQSRGLPVPARTGRALHRAIRVARTPDFATTRSGPRLMPLLADAEQALGRFFDARLRLAAVPADETARRAFDDALFTLGVLMGQPCAPAAVREALQYTQG